jgi:metal-sulfur cluster biosynthetic enzyme
VSAVAGGDRRAEVLARLDRVSDPELDEPVTDLGFVTEVAVEAGRVDIRFRLPTYWCAANFAFLMADDMRREVAALPWVEAVAVEIGEHMYADRINDGLRRGLGFREAFGTAADADLDEVRRIFARKSFQRRQEAALRALLAAGHAPAALVALSVAALRGLAHADAPAVARYLDRRAVAGAFDGASLAFVDLDGGALPAESLQRHLRALRNVAVNIEFNATLCRGLLAARFNEAETHPGEPTLRDFVLQAAAGGA